jgi:hypothetical protein
MASWFAALGASAQADVTPGTRVRVSEAARRFTGTLDAVDERTLTLREQSDAAPVTLSRAQIVRLEVSRKPSRRAKGALIGGALGVVAGLVLMAAEGSSCPPEQDPFGICSDLSGPEFYVASAGLLGAAGAGLGALIARGEKWETVPTNRLRVTAGASPSGGVRLGFALVF